MTFQTTVDDGGFQLSLLQTADGRFAGNAFNANTIDNLPNVKLRDDDILLCSYAKSGCHWIWQNIRMLYHGEVFSDDIDKEETMMEYHTIDYIDSLPSPRLLNTHVFFDKLPSDVLKGRVKVVFMYRNPKDIAVSFYYHAKRLGEYKYQGNFDSYIKRFSQGQVSNNSVFDYWKSYEKGFNANPQIPVCVMSYEGLKKNPIPERRRLAEFLGRQYQDDFLEKVTSSTSIDHMRQQKGGPVDTAGSVFYRKGEVGDWKNHFTVSENDNFDQLITTHLSDSKLFNFVYTL